MRELPTGTITFLFTDIEGSTRLLNDLGDAYADVLAEHHRAMRDAFRHHSGVEFGTEGDAFSVTGEPVVTEESYVGIDVHRAARICAAAHGRQVVLSERTRALLDAEVELKDLGRPEKLFQLGAADFPRFARSTPQICRRSRRRSSGGSTSCGSWRRSCAPADSSRSPALAGAARRDWRSRSPRS